MTPKSCEIKIGYQCNNRCLFCLNRHKITRKSPTTGQIINHILNAKKKGIRIIALTGGEPTIRKDFLTLCNFIVKHGMYLIIHSNGRMFYSETFVKKLSEISKFRFLISVHGHNAEIHDKLTKATNSFRQTKNGITNLLSHGHIVNTNTVINTMNLNHLPKITSFLKDLGVEHIVLTFPEIQGAAEDNIDLIPTYIQGVKYLRQSINEIKDNNYTLVNFPLCVIPEEMEHIKVKEPFSDYESGKYWEDASERDKTKNIKLPICEKCKFLKSCPGISKKYFERYGDSEFCTEVLDKHS